MQVGDRIRVFEVLNGGGYSTDYTGKQAAEVNIDYKGLVDLCLSTKGCEHLAYEIGKEAKHVATMVIKSIKK